MLIQPDADSGESKPSGAPALASACTAGEAVTPGRVAPHVGCGCVVLLLSTVKLGGLTSQDRGGTLQRAVDL
jgi:hypothetical protein